MLDGTPARTVWGFEIEVSASGRNRWPDPVKEMAAAKVLDEDHTISSVAREILANETMVRRWVNEERVRRRKKDSNAPAFVEVVLSEPETPVRSETFEPENDRPASRHLFHLEFEGAKITLPTDLTEPDITRIIRGVRAAL